ncbi:MAG: response regulator transcription factor [Gracilibacteraceae bacterium]|jgi:DNA-binding response OmpR family regulator|nr:response regulator transcription factor [Gracilibacteraceae bacterium]
MMEKILLIEDEEKMARMVELELCHEGYTVIKALNGLDGLALAEGEDVDLILLDVMLPGLSGLEVLRRLRKYSSVPVIMLTARDAVVDKVAGLDAGADDYITKPFAIEELLARIRAALRKQAGRGPLPAAGALTAGPLTLDAARREVRAEGRPVELTNREFELLHCLMQNKGLVLSRGTLLDRVWGYEYPGGTNTVDVYIRFLRGKIDEKIGVRLIQTVRGVGYRLADEA